MESTVANPMEMKGWLRVEEVDGDLSLVSQDGAQERWVVLSNGVLWIRRTPHQHTYEGSLPLMNTVLERAPGSRILTVRMRGSDREFRLHTVDGEEEEIAKWEVAMAESKRKWAEKRRASAHFRMSQAIPSGNKSKLSDISSLENGKLRETEEVPKTPEPPTAKNRTLREIIATCKYGPKGQKIMPSWENLPEVTSSGLSDSLEEKDLRAACIAFRLAASEAEYNEELNNLCQLGTRIVVQWTNDPSPTFLRRALAAHIQKMKSHSDTLMAKLESLWEKRATLTGVHGLYAQAVPKLRTSYAGYSGHLEDIRLIIQRALETHPDAMWAASTGNGKRELSLAPLQRLTTLRIMLQRSTANDTPLKYEEKGDAKRAMEAVKELLDECYAEMTSQSGTEYVAEIDNLLDFGELISGKSPLLMLLAACADSDNSDNEGEGANKEQTEHKKKIECSASRPSIFWNGSVSVNE